MIDTLTKIGLTLYESKICSTLLEYSQLNARQIAEKSTVPPTAVYPNLYLLQEKQLIQELRGKVRHFDPLQKNNGIWSMRTLMLASNSNIFPSITVLYSLLTAKNVRLH